MLDYPEIWNIRALNPRYPWASLDVNMRAENESHLDILNGLGNEGELAPWIWIEDSGPGAVRWEPELDWD